MLSGEHTHSEVVDAGCSHSLYFLVLGRVRVRPLGSADASTREPSNSGRALESVQAVPNKARGSARRAVVTAMPLSLPRAACRTRRAPLTQPASTK